MPSQQDVTTFTLSFSGVNFTLEPSNISNNNSNNAHGNDGDILSIAKVTNRQVVIDFRNFSGVLRVTHKDRCEASDGVESAMLPLSVLQTDEKNAEDGNHHAIATTAAKNHIMESAAASVPDAVPEEEADSPLKQRKDDKEKNKGGRQQTTLNFFKDTKSKSKRISEDKSVFSRKKTRSSTTAAATIQQKHDNAIHNNNENDESTTDVEESQNTKFTMASLGQDMPSQESGEDADMMMAAAAVQTPVDNGTTTSYTDTALDQNNNNSSTKEPHDDFSFNLDDIPGEDDYMTNMNHKLTPLKVDDHIMTPPSTKNPEESLTPCPRWGQSMTMIDHRRLVVYGGQTIDPSTQLAMPLSDCYVYDLMDHTWVKPMNCEGVARTWHTSNFLPEKNLLLCFGGDVVDDKGKTTTTDQVMVLDTEIMLWYPPSVSGQVPSGRSGHTASLLPQSNELVVFGGVKNGKWLNSVSVLDYGRWHWSTPKIIGDAPRPRSYHSSTALCTEEGMSRIVIFGGNNDTKCFNTVHVLDQTTQDKMTWSSPKVSGKAPSPRTGHTATLLDDGCTIMIYGGWDPNTEDEKGDDVIFGDSFLLDTKSWTWSKGPKARYASFNDASVGNGGLERVGHSAVLAPGGEGVQVLAFGGRLRDGFAADFQSLLPVAQPVQREASSRRKAGER